MNPEIKAALDHLNAVLDEMERRQLIRDLIQLILGLVPGFPISINWELDPIETLNAWVSSIAVIFQAPE